MFSEAAFFLGAFGCGNAEDIIECAAYFAPQKAFQSLSGEEFGIGWRIGVEGCHQRDVFLARYAFCRTRKGEKGICGVDEVVLGEFFRQFGVKGREIGMRGNVGEEF